MNTVTIQPIRKIVQYLFLAVIVLIGVQFTLFVNQLEKGLLPTVTRPPGIEGLNTGWSPVFLIPSIRPV